MADTSEFKLSSEEHKRVFEQSILNNPEIVESIATPQERPKAVVLAGQPGVGKGSLAREVKTAFNDNIVTIDPDILRDKYPNVDVLKRQYPYTWSDLTHNDASDWSKELSTEIIKQHKNILIDGTKPKLELIQKLKGEGYEVEVRVVATHQLESVLGVEKRFMDDMHDDGLVAMSRHISKNQFITNYPPRWTRCVSSFQTFACASITVMERYSMIRHWRKILNVNLHWH